MKANIEFHYMYRDGYNNKDHSIIVFANPSSSKISINAAKVRIISAFDEGEYFIAEQIGIPSIFLWSADANYNPEDPKTFPKDLGPGKYVISDQDHCWHEFDGIAESDLPPCDPRTFRKFVEDIEAASKKGWTEFDPMAIRKGV